MSTAGDSMRLALRTRVSMSAIGSVIMAAFLPRLPARLLHAGDQTLVGHVAEADAAQAELAVDRAGPAAQPAAHADADAVARAELRLGRLALGEFQLLELAEELNVLGVGGHYSALGTAHVAKPQAVGYASRNGIPNRRSSSRDSSSLLLSITKVTSIPCEKLTLSGSISGKTI